MLLWYDVIKLYNLFLVSIYMASSLWRLLHNVKLLGNGELGARLAAHLFHLNARSQLGQSELTSFPVDLENTLYFVSKDTRVYQARDIPSR